MEPEWPVMPEFDFNRSEAEPGPVRRPGNGAVAVFLLEPGNGCFEGCPIGQWL